MVRLLLASYAYPPSVGGVEKHSQRLARALVGRGHTVEVITAALDDAPAHERDEYGVDITRVAKGTGSRWRKMATYVAAMLAETARRAHRVDVIHVQQALYPAAAMSVAARALGKPLIVRSSGSGAFGAVQLMRSLPLGTAGLAAIRRLATTVSLSDEMTAELAHAGFTSIVKIRNGVDLPRLPSRAEARRQLGIDPATKVVLYVGRLAAEKGTALLARAWATVPEALLLVAGDGPDRGMIERAPRCRVDGFVSDVSPYLAAADVFVLPSASEGISNALLEAMAAGLPVVATDVGGNREVISTPALGILVSASDPRELTAALRAILADPTQRQALGAAAQRHVATAWSFEAMVTAYETLYEASLRR